MIRRSFLKCGSRNGDRKAFLCYQFFTVGDPAPRFDVLVMNTYILAQLALVLGFCL